jgi:hypothetical protein
MKTHNQILRSAAIIFLVLIFANQTFAAKVATFTTHINGGIASNEYHFTPYIAFKGDAPLFSTRMITTADEGVTFVISSDFDDVNYTNFINKLTNSEDEMLSIGHKIGQIKTEVSNNESNWFKDLKIKKDEITFITLTYKNLKFEPSTTNKDEWTNFSYELTVSIFSDDDMDGVALDINIDKDVDGVDFAFVDYETAEKLGGGFTAKGGGSAEDGKMTVTKVQEGVFVVVRADNVAEKKYVQIMFVSSKK